MSRTKWGKGKVEVFALRIEILELFAQGQNQTEIYQTLVASGKLTVGMRTFSRHAKTLKDTDAATRTNPTPVKPPPPSPTKLQKPNDGGLPKAKFFHNPKPSDSTDW